METDAGQQQVRTMEAAPCCWRPGSFRSFAEFHPLNILYITTKITQKTTNFNGISKPSQSILPSLSTCFSRHLLLTATCWICQQKINGGFPPTSCEALTGSRPGAQTTSPNKIPENWYSSREFGSFGTGRAVPGRQLTHRLSTTTVDNLNGVWEF